MIHNIIMDKCEIMEHFEAGSRITASSILSLKRLQAIRAKTGLNLFPLLKECT